MKNKDIVFTDVVGAVRMSKSKRKFRNSKTIKRKVLANSKRRKTIKNYYINQQFVFDEASNLLAENQAK